LIQANPTSLSDVATYTISLTVSDSVKSVESSFEVTVSNTPPILIAAELPDQKLSLNSLGSYDLS
jgi:hypothetical protein